MTVDDSLVAELAEDIAVAQLAIELAGVGQARDYHGRWTSGPGAGGAAPAGSVAPKDLETMKSKVQEQKRDPKLQDEDGKLMTKGYEAQMNHLVDVGGGPGGKDQMVKQAVDTNMQMNSAFRGDTSGLDVNSTRLVRLGERNAAADALKIVKVNLASEMRARETYTPRNYL